MDNNRPYQPIGGLKEIITKYPFLICDLWGVVHDGFTAFPDAMDAIRSARAMGSLVVFVSNSPQRRTVVADRMIRLGIVASDYDALITSGELSRTYLADRFQGQRFYHLGPDWDRETVRGVNAREADDIGCADVILATGLIEDNVSAHETLLQRPAAANIPMICANPDRIVRHGTDILQCAGVIADLYEALGGPVIWMGKPAPAPYHEAKAAFAQKANRPVGDSEILAIGDGLMTDIAGAARQNMDSLFIRSGVHGEELQRICLDEAFKRHGVVPTYLSETLSW